MNQHDPTAANLRRLLAAAHLTQREAARRLHISSRTVRRWCKDGGMPYAVQLVLEQLTI